MIEGDVNSEGLRESLAGLLFQIIIYLSLSLTMSQKSLFFLCSFQIFSLLFHNPCQDMYIYDINSCHTKLRVNLQSERLSLVRHCDSNFTVYECHSATVLYSRAI